MLACASVGGGASVDSGQPERGGTPAGALPATPAQSVLRAMALGDALATAVAGKKLLVVVTSTNKGRETENTKLWAHPALAAWAARHALVVHVTDEATIGQLNEAELATGGPDQPLLFADGKSIRLFGSSPKTNVCRIRGAPRVKGAAATYGPALRLLMRLEWSLRGHGRVEPVWLAAHDAACPEAQRPVIVAQALVSDAGAMSFAEAMAGDGAGAGGGLDGAGGGDMLGRLIAAIALVERARGEGDDAKPAARRAAGLLVGVWEQGIGTEPHVGPAAVFEGARAMHELGRISPKAMARFRALRDAQAAMLPWMNKRELFNWLMLCRVVGDPVDALDFFDACLDDADAVLLMPPEERMALETLLPRVAWEDPLALPSTGADGVKYVERLRDGLVGAAPKVRGGAAMEAGAFKRLLAWRASQFVDESSRVYAALLVKGRDEQAVRVAEIAAEALKERPRPLWLVSAALARGQAREHQLAWLTAGDAATVRVRERVKGMMRTRSP